MVTIGFNKTAYSVSEDAGSVSITLSVQMGAQDRDVVVTLSSINGTALCKFLKELKSTVAASMLILHSLISSAEEDYTPVSTNVTFNASTSTHTVNIPILDNEIVAGSTIFNVSLTSADPAAILNPASAGITIEDDDSEKPQILCMWENIACKWHYFIPLYPVITIGFNPATYTVAESDGSVNVTVNILNGTLARNVHVLLMTALTDGTATGT